MKMSLCNTFRLFVLSLIIVLSSIDTPTAFTLRRTAGGGEPSRHLAQESVLVEIKKQIKRSTNTETDLENNEKLSINTSETGPSNETREINKNKNDTISQVSDSYKIRKPAAEHQVSSSINSSELSQTNNPEPKTESLPLSNITNVTIDDIKDVTDTSNDNGPKITINTRKIEFIVNENTTVIANTLKSGLPETSIYESAKLPTWKKYTTIDRKRQSTTKTDDVPMKKPEGMIKAETKQMRSSLKDTVTSDIPSLEQLKNEFLYSSSKEQESELETQSSIITEVNTFTDIIPSTKWDKFESKRAGYLDLSEKVTTEQSSLTEGPEIKTNSKETMRAMFESENPETDIPEQIFLNRAESQSQLNEDSIKEEFLKEKLIKENEENAQRSDPKIQFSLETQNVNSTSLQINFSNELSVKPVNSDKIKNASLYTVNPNYKPLKKIEVQAPKQFVRDPDDNSWRNESLSSLGIVFKPKNSSKPFTQVLKNKTETEWNSLSEKDSKNDIPDLKERLQKMTEKRKSKRKKTDLFGNVVYFDYEENSSSGEHISTSQPLSSTTSSEESPTPTTINSFSSNSTEETSENTTPSTSTTGEVKSKSRNPYSTKKFRKFFNVPEYYDSTDEDETDYLNMAKIDIKKYSTSPRTLFTTTPTSTHQPWVISKVSHTVSPERKATIQYFPPLTTQKVNINNYDDFKLKVNSFTNTEPPKNIIPVSYEKSTTPNSVQYTTLNNEKLNDFMTTKPNYEKVYTTQPPQRTRAEFTLQNVDLPVDRDSYVIRHYKDFINEAAKDNEFDKNVDYVPYTEGPARDVTKTNQITYMTEDAKLQMDNEYDYETQFRKDVLQRFVDNFNRNSERFKSDFPVLFNSSVIHRDTENGNDIASSRAFMRGLYNTDRKAKIHYKEASDPNENMTVELSPSYELHYYMPEQEEKEEVVPQPVTLPYQYRL